MRYAVISDIHGNLPALDAVLADAQRQNCQRYLFLGDYIQDFPYPNEVVRRLRALPVTCVIAGNKELDYLDLVEQKLAAGESPRQFAPMFWNYREMTRETLGYLKSLPKKANLPVENGTTLYLSHSFQDFFKSYERWQQSSFHYSVRMETKPFLHTDFLRQIQTWLSEDMQLKKELKSKPDGIYLFGHTHVQWHAQLHGKLLVNPGSCGVPLDYNPHASYTVLESHSDGASWAVEERRVPYDLEALTEEMLQSSLYREAPLWSDIVLGCAKTGKDDLCSFFQQAHQIAEAYGADSACFSDDIWELAGEHWKRQQGKRLRQSEILPSDQQIL